MDDQWWYCLTHKTVEQGSGCPNKDRLGPYADEGSAARALQTVQENNDRWDAEDAE